jgi:hypothetical protein
MHRELRLKLGWSISSSQNPGELAPRHLPGKYDSAHYTFASFFKVVTIGGNTVPESLRPIEKSLISGDWS